WSSPGIKSLAGAFNQVQVIGDFAAKTIPASAILRCARTVKPAQGKCQADKCRWDLYVDADLDNGDGSGALKTGTVTRYRWMRAPTGEAITLCDNSKLQWSEIQDLIIAKQ